MNKSSEHGIDPQIAHQDLEQERKPHQPAVIRLNTQDSLAFVQYVVTTKGEQMTQALEPYLILLAQKDGEFNIPAMSQFAREQIAKYDDDLPEYTCRAAWQNIHNLV